MGILPKRKEIRKAIEEASDLDMTRVIAAGLIEGHYRGRLDPKDVDSMSAAALLVDAENFDDIFEMFDPLTTSIVDEIRMTDELEDPDQYYNALSQMEPESKRVFIALQLAELEAAQEDLKEGRDGPYPDDHEEMAEKIAAAYSDGVLIASRTVSNIPMPVASDTIRSGKNNRMPNTAMGRPTQIKSRRQYIFQPWRIFALTTALSNESDISSTDNTNTVHAPASAPEIPPIPVIEPT